MVAENDLATRGPQLVERYRAMVSKTMEKLGEPLSEQQRKALALLMEDKPIREAAQEVGVGKTTLYRWIQEDPKFRAAFNAWELEQLELDRITLRRCGKKVVAKIERMIDMDEKLALAVARELGLFKPQKYRAINPLQARYEIALEQWEQEEMMERKANQHLDAKKQRMLMELDMEEVMDQEDEERERDMSHEKQ
jgi:DNA invertase Pin-like site-specific DNA recombinase